MDKRPETAIGDPTEAANKLAETFRNWDKESERHRKHRLTFVRVAIFFVGPVAVLLLAVQVIFLEHEWPAAWFIFAEVLLLIFALAIPFLKLGRSHDHWIEARVRTEVLGREQCLLFAQVGPYLGLTAASAAEEVGKRLADLERNLGESTELLKSTHAPMDWRDRLEDSKASHYVLADVRDRARQYLQKRVVAQQNWFEKRSQDHKNRSRRLENCAKLVLTLALVLASMHLGTLLWPPRNPHHGWEIALQIAALWLPAVGGAIVAYRSALGSQRQALSYKYYADVMTPFRDELQTLAGEGHAGATDTLKFKRLVLDVEGLLIDELRLWWMNMVIKEPHTTA